MLDSVLNEVPEPHPDCNFIKKETPAQVFSWEICKIFKTIIFTDLGQIISSNLLLKGKILSNSTQI